MSRMIIVDAGEALASSKRSHAFQRYLDEKGSALTHFRTSELVRSRHRSQLEAFNGEGDRIFHAD